MPAGAAGINARFRFFRYEGGTVYRRHVDGSWPAAGLTPEAGGEVFGCRGWFPSERLVSSLETRVQDLGFRV